MNITLLNRCLMVLIFCTPLFSKSQSPQYSEFILKYNLSTHQVEDNKKIPFDHPFTLIVDSLSGKNVKAIQIFKSEIVKGVRELSTSKIINCKGKIDTIAVMDKELSYKVGADKLIIYFDALKPNTLFDIYVIYDLIPASRNILLEANISVAKGDFAGAGKLFSKFRKSTAIENSLSRYMTLDSTDYISFYQAKLKGYYDGIDGHSDPVVATLSKDELLAIGMSATKDVPGYKNANLLLSVISEDKSNSILDGTFDIFTYASGADPADRYDWAARVSNLNSNIKFYSSLLEALDNALLSGKDSIKVNGADIDLAVVRGKLRKIHTDALAPNLKYLVDKGKEINLAINANPVMRSAFYLSGSTVASDLKTAGGSVLFLDAGLTNLFVPGVNNKLVYLPRLYWGVSIYFRPIDKNTRTNTFYRKRDLPINKNCSNNKIGPDYDVIATRSIWQHLSLNLGFTLGSLPNADFENFYNNTSLLIGPAYRFKRAFKFSMGASMLKRTSQNPMYSDKKVVVGTYASLSVDIDFIQGLKDITSILFK